MRKPITMALTLLTGGLLIAWSAAAPAQDTDPLPRHDPPVKKATAPPRDRDPEPGARVDQPRTERDREVPPRRNRFERSGTLAPEARRPQAEAAVAPPIGAGAPLGMGRADGPGRRFPMRGPNAEPRRPGGFPGMPGMEGSRPMGAGFPWRPGEGPDQEMLKLDQQDMELGQRCMQLAAALRSATPEQRDALRKQLREMVDKHFDVRQQRRELQLKRLEQQLQELREAIERRMKVRDQIIDRRMAELTGEEDPLDF